MRERKTRLKEILRGIERTKQYVMRELNALGYNKETVRRTIVYPVAKVKPIYIKDYPVFHFAYEGALPLYDEENSEYNSMIRSYYYNATFDAYDYSKLSLPMMEDATIIFVHYFNDMKIRDLDNRNRKFIQDAIKLTGIIEDDNWQNVWNLEIAFYDKNKCHVQVYVIPSQKLPHFIGYLMDNHRNMIIDLEEKRTDFEKKMIRNSKKEGKKIPSFDVNKLEEESIYF